MPDPTDSIRRAMVADINSDPLGRNGLESLHGQVWDISEVRKEFEIVAFLAPFVEVKRKRDGAIGSMLFQAFPRFYFGWQKDR